MTGSVLRLKVPTAADMERVGGNAASGIEAGQVIFLRGELGAGKTTWVRGMLRRLHHTGAVKSPTYTLLETYTLTRCNVYHFDLYRISTPEELEQLAFRDYLDGSGVCLVEWPEQGRGLLPEPDCMIDFQYDIDGRCLTMNCTTQRGKSICAAMR